jgi:hypothetical protein
MAADLAERPKLHLKVPPEPLPASLPLNIAHHINLRLPPCPAHHKSRSRQHLQVQLALLCSSITRNAPRNLSAPSPQVHVYS